MSLSVTTILKCATSSLSFVRNVFAADPFDNAANNEIITAKRHFEAAKRNSDAEELKFALTHLEVAASLVCSTSFFRYVLVQYIPKKKKIEMYNKLCYQIAYIHSQIGSDYETILEWAKDTFEGGPLYFPVQFEDLLHEEDYYALKDRTDWRLTSSESDTIDYRDGGSYI